MMMDCVFPYFLLPFAYLIMPRIRNLICRNQPPKNTPYQAFFILIIYDGLMHGIRVHGSDVVECMSYLEMFFDNGV